MEDVWNINRLIELENWFLGENFVDNGPVTVWHDPVWHDPVWHDPRGRADPIQPAAIPLIDVPRTEGSGNAADALNASSQPALARPTLQPPPPATDLLQDPLTAGGRSSTDANYGQELRGRPEVNVQPPLNIEITMREITAFFPAWFLIPDVIVRAVRNGYNDTDIAKMQLYATNQLTRQAMGKAKGRIRKQISEGGQLKLGTAKMDSREVRNTHGVQNDLTANGWKLRSQYDQKKRQMKFSHLKLVYVYRNVPRRRWPEGPDRLLVTRWLEFAADNPHLDLDTSHFDWIIQTQGLQATPSGGAQNDIQGVKVFNRAVPTP